MSRLACRPSFRMAIYLRDRLTCAYCPATVIEVPFTLDHLRFGDGAKNNPQFVVSACLPCNSRRQTTPFLRFVPKQSDRRRILRRAAKPLDPYQDAARVLLAAPGGPPTWWVVQTGLARRRAKGSAADEAMARVMAESPYADNNDEVNPYGPDMHDDDEVSL